MRPIIIATMAVLILTATAPPLTASGPFGPDALHQSQSAEVANARPASEATPQAATPDAKNTGKSWIVRMPVNNTVIPLAHPSRSIKASTPEARLGAEPDTRPQRPARKAAAL